MTRIAIGLTILLVHAQAGLAWVKRAPLAAGAIDDSAASVVIDARGDLIVGGALERAATGAEIGVVKLAPGTGKELWRTRIPGVYGSGRIAVDAEGDLLMSGLVTTGDPPGSGGPFDPGTPAPVALAVVKLAGANGRETWRSVVDAGDGGAEAGEITVGPEGDVFTTVWFGGSLFTKQVVALDGFSGSVSWQAPLGGRRFALFRETAPIVVSSQGDLFVASAGYAGPNGDVLSISRLSTDSGEQLWTIDLPDAWRPTGLALDHRGDLFVVASLGRSPIRRLVAKLAGATGALLWQATLSKGDNLDIALTPEGDVFAAGDALVPGITAKTASVLSVVKLDGETGSRIWEQRSDAATPGSALSAVSDPSGNVYVAGTLESGAAQQFSVLKLDGARGDILWARSLATTEDPETDTYASDLLLDLHGRVVSVGSLLGEGTGLDFAIASFNAATGSDEPSCRSARGCGDAPLLIIPRASAGTLPRR